MTVNQDTGSRNVRNDQQKAAVEFVAWADHHGHDERLHKAAIGQIEDHPDRNDGASATAQQMAWARRHDHERRLHDSAMAQLRYEV